MTINPVLYYCLLPPALVLYLGVGVQFARYLRKWHKEHRWWNAILDVLLWPLVAVVLAASVLVLGVGMLLFTAFTYIYDRIEKAGDYMAKKIYGDKG